MKKIIPYIMVLAQTVLIFIACDKEKPGTYTDLDKVYFYHKDTVPAVPVQIDSASVSIKGKNVDGDSVTVHITTQLMGNMSAVDRPVSVRQINTEKEGAAVPGVHYVPFEECYIVIPAGKSTGEVPVTILRSEYLLDNEVTLEMEVLPNEFFQTGLPQHLTFKLTFTDMYAKPAIWSDWSTYFGASWGQVKFEFLIRYVTGDIDWNDATPMYSYLPNYWSMLAKEKLEEYNAAQGPDPKNWLRERNGDLVTFDS